MQFHSTTLKVIRKTKDFYTGLQGLEIEHDFGKNVILSAELTLGEVIPGHIRRKQKFYNLNAIISVCYRIKYM